VAKGVIADQDVFKYHEDGFLLVKGMLMRFRPWGAQRAKTASSTSTPMARPMEKVGPSVFRSGIIPPIPSTERLRAASRSLALQKSCLTMRSITITQK